MQRILSIACLAAASFFCSSLAVAQIPWQSDLAAARRVSQQYGVPVLIHFYGDNCLPCRTLEQNVFSKPEVITTVQKFFVPVHINATSDRKTAAEFGVHSWPTDVFLAPDGKVLTQGVCAQKPNDYLHNLQSVAVMNRDRSVMLAAKNQSMQGQPAAPGVNSLGSQNTTGVANGSALAGTQQPYGRLVSSSMQDSAPGRSPEDAPSPYYDSASPSNPNAGFGNSSRGSWNNAPSNDASQLGPSNVSASPNIQTGPLHTSAPVATVHPSQSAMSFQGKDANLPPTQSPTGSSQTAATRFAPVANRYAGSLSHPAGTATLEAMPGMPTTPNNPAPAPTTNKRFESQPIEIVVEPGQGAPVVAGRSSTAFRNTNSVVENPHFASPSQPIATPAAVAVNTVSNSNTAPNATSVTPNTQLSTANKSDLVALDGYCPVALFTTTQWVEGNPNYAVRHRGQVYHLASEQAAQAFLANPDLYCPVLAGFDPYVYVTEGKLIPGTVQQGLIEVSPTRILLFSSERNKELFRQDFARLYEQLERLVQMAQIAKQSGSNSPVLR